MTTHAISATHLAASLPSIAPRPALALFDGDVSVTATFHLTDPIGSTEVTTSPAFLSEMDDTALLNLLDATITRLTTYRDAFRAALDEDTRPAPPALLPTPWYAW
jgi:hypothetical protein